MDQVQRSFLLIYSFQWSVIVEQHIQPLYSLLSKPLSNLTQITTNRLFDPVQGSGFKLLDFFYTAAPSYNVYLHDKNGAVMQYSVQGQVILVF